MKFMPACREVAEATSRDQLAQMSFGRRVLIRWHLFRCRDCQAYRDQILSIGRAARGLYDRGEAESGWLDDLEASILRKLEGGPDRDRPPSDR